MDWKVLSGNKNCRKNKQNEQKKKKREIMKIQFVLCLYDEITAFKQSVVFFRLFVCYLE